MSEKMDYKYVILNGGKPPVSCSRFGGYKFFLGIFILVGLLAGVSYVVVYVEYRSHHRRDLTEQKLLLISIDAFRYNMRDKAPTPNLDQLVANGVSCDHMLNVFPTVTLPNHQSIVTGLYPENHGIISNDMYDRETGEIFDMSNTQSKFWKDGIPIWIDNELQGHESGVCFWPGYDVLFEGRQAKYLPNKSYTSPMSYDYYVQNASHNMPLDMTVDLVVDWLKHDKVNFAALYIGELDTVEHAVGPDPLDAKGLDELQSMIMRIDGLIGKITRNLKDKQLDSHVNIIIVGDHGQVNTNRTSKVIDLQKYVNLTEDALFYGGHFIYAKPGRTEKLYEQLKLAENREGHFKVYLKKDIPDDFHVRKHNRTGDIMLLVDPGWSISTREGQQFSAAGTHGYSNLVKDMNPVFIANGPLFRKNYKQEVINMVDLYSLMCHILEIKPRQNDGNFTRIESILEEYS